MIQVTESLVHQIASSRIRELFIRMAKMFSPIELTDQAITSRRSECEVEFLEQRKPSTRDPRSGFGIQGKRDQARRVKGVKSSKPARALHVTAWSRNSRSFQTSSGRREQTRPTRGYKRVKNIDKIISSSAIQTVKESKVQQ